MRTSNHPSIHYSMTSKIVEGEEEMDDRLKVIKPEKEEVENERGMRVPLINSLFVLTSHCNLLLSPKKTKLVVLCNEIV